jgi:hypothetical protein
MTPLTRAPLALAVRQHAFGQAISILRTSASGIFGLPVPTLSFHTPLKIVVYLAENKALTLVCSIENGLFMGQKTLEDLLQQLWPLREALAFDPDESTKEAIGDWHTGSLRGGVL